MVRGGDRKHLQLYIRIAVYIYYTTLEHGVGDKIGVGWREEEMKILPGVKTKKGQEVRWRDVDGTVELEGL